MIVRRLQQCLDVLEWPLPSNFWLQTGVLAVFAGLPFAPLDWLSGSYPMAARGVAAATLVLSLYAFVFMFLSAILVIDDADFAVQAKRFGQPYEATESFRELDNNPWWGLASLTGVVVVVAVVVATSVASMGYGLIHHLGVASPFGVQAAISTTDVTYGPIHHARFDGPFGVRPGAWDILLYFYDQAFKGALFDFCEIFGVSLQTKLRVSSQFTSIWPYLMFGYRLLMSLMILQILRLAFAYLLRSVDTRSELPRTKEEAGQLRLLLQNALRELEEKRHRSPHELKSLAAEYHQLWNKRQANRRRRLGWREWDRLNVLDRILTVHRWQHKPIARRW